MMIVSHKFHFLPELEDIAKNLPYEMKSSLLTVTTCRSQYYNCKRKDCPSPPTGHPGSLVLRLVKEQ